MCFKTSDISEPIEVMCNKK